MDVQPKVTPIATAQQCSWCWETADFTVAWSEWVLDYACSKHAQEYWPEQAAPAGNYGVVAQLSTGAGFHTVPDPEDTAPPASGVYRLHGTITANPTHKDAGTRTLVVAAYSCTQGAMFRRACELISAYGLPHMSAFTGPAGNLVEKFSWEHEDTRSTSTLWIQHP